MKLQVQSHEYLKGKGQRECWDWNYGPLDEVDAVNIAPFAPLCRAFNSQHVRARCNLAVEEFKVGKGKTAKARSGTGDSGGGGGEGDELAEGGDLEEVEAAAAAVRVCVSIQQQKCHRPPEYNYEHLCHIARQRICIPPYLGVDTVHPIGK